MATYTFTLPQQLELDAAFLLGPTVDWQPGTHFAFYSKIVGNYPLPSFLRRQESIADLHDVFQHYLRDYRLRGNDGRREQLQL